MITSSTQNSSWNTRKCLVFALGSFVGVLYGIHNYLYLLIDASVTQAVVPLITTRPDNRTSPQNLNTRLTEAPKLQGFTRAAIVFLPTEPDKQQKYLHQLKWFLKSWRFMSASEPADWRTDVLVVTRLSNDTAELIHALDCQDTFRSNRNETNRCIFITDFESQRTLGNAYVFGPSVGCVLFAHNLGALQPYDYILRTDMDTFLTPAFATWKPLQFTVGKGAYCFPGLLTCHRLDRVATDLGYQPHGAEMIQNVGSTWYGPTDRIVAAVNVTVSTMDYLDTWEFEKDARRMLQRTSWRRQLRAQSWPAWHHGVLSMYAGQIAVNYVQSADKGGFVKRTDMLDFPSTSDASVAAHAHVHTWQNDDSFSKFVYMTGKYDTTILATLDLTMIKDYAMYMALTANNKGV